MLGRSVGERNGSAAGPYSGKTGKRAGLGVARRHRQHERGADACGLDCLPKKSGTKLHIEFSHSNDVLVPRHVSPHQRFSVAAVCQVQTTTTALPAWRGTGRRRWAGQSVNYTNQLAHAKGIFGQWKPQIVANLV